MKCRGSTGIVEPTNQIFLGSLQIVLMKCGDLIGAAAVCRLVELKGMSVKNELVQSFVGARDDYNYCCNGLASALRSFATPDDARRIAALAESIEDEVPVGADDEVAYGFTYGAAQFLSGLDLAIIREAFLPKEKSEPLSEVRARVLCGILQGVHSTDALEFAADLLLLGVRKAATIIYFIANFAKPADALSWAAFSREHVDCLVSKLHDEEDKSWSLKALKLLCEARPDMAKVVGARASTESGILKAALLNCASSDPAPVFEALAELSEMGLKERELQCVRLLDQIELNWSGHEVLFLQLLRLRDTRLALAIIGHIYNNFSPQDLREFEIGPIGWWLEWLIEESNGDSRSWFLHLMPWLLAKVLNAGGRHAFVAEFNKEGSRFRSLLARSVLPYFSDLTTDSFSEDAISFLLADLNRAGSAVGFRVSLLGNTATEQFVAERLLPLLSDAKPPLADNLRIVLGEAGSRHGRRYIRA